MGLFYQDKALRMGTLILEQDGHCTYSVTLRRVRTIIVAVEKQ